MKTTSSAPSGLSVLTLRIQVPDDSPDRPVVDILVDGTRAFEDVAPGWCGFDPDDLLGPTRPLLPAEPGRRTAVCTCSCGIAGCGVIAPYVVPSPDGRRVSWVDFRDYVGVFDQPVAPGSDAHEGRPWDLADLHFDRGQYKAEVDRATADRSWETPRRTLARLVRERVEARPDVLPRGHSLRFVCPAWHDEDGIVIALTVTDPDGQGMTDGPLLHLRTDNADPVVATDDITMLLSGRPAGDLLRRCGVQYGSTLRNLGETGLSLAVFEQAREAYPASASLMAFEALTLHAAGRLDEAVALLLEAVASSAEGGVGDDARRYVAALRGNAEYVRSIGRG